MNISHLQTGLGGTDTTYVMYKKQNNEPGKKSDKIKVQKDNTTVFIVNHFDQNKHKL